VVLLPALIFGAEVKGARMLQIRGQNDCFIPSFSGKLHSEIPRIKSNEDEVEVLGDQVFVGKRIKSIDRISKGSRVSYVFPS
jgi:hypothetical protein